MLPAFLTSGGPLHLIKGFQHLFRTRPDSDIFREIYPANCPGGINKKLRRAGNIGAFRSCAGMQQIVTTNDFRLGIGKNV